MELNEFIYDLPREFIAQRPMEDRASSKMLVLDLTDGSIEHRIFHTILDEFSSGDVLVVNDSRVIPARLMGTKPTGGKVEVFLIRELSPDEWEVFINGKKIRSDTTVFIPDAGAPAIRVLPLDRISGTRFRARLEVVMGGGTVREAIDRYGLMPTPPYIRELLERPDRYQTVYALNEGSVAAPTAGFHFTPELLDRIRAKGVGVAPVTLHVGLGTFVPVKVSRVEDHVMEEEHYFIDPGSAGMINTALERQKQGKGRLWVCGTTSVRCLESAADEGGRVRSGHGIARLFIYPGYRFRVDFRRFITNFHLPGSTLIMLVSAYAGRERVLAVYEEAKRRNYRFYSFGDAMLLKR